MILDGPRDYRNVQTQTDVLMIRASCTIISTIVAMLYHQLSCENVVPTGQLWPTKLPEFLSKPNKLPYSCFKHVYARVFFLVRKRSCNC